MTGSVIIIMGVSGSGKTSVGQAIAGAQAAVFIDGDDLHPAANIEKMSRGIPLTDEDRRGWLDTIAQEAAKIIQLGKKGVIACSALKRQYRERLRSGISCLTFVYLKAPYEKVFQQLGARQGHFMPVSLLESQFALLEEPDREEADVVTVIVEKSLDETVALALKKLDEF